MVDGGQKIPNREIEGESKRPLKTGRIMEILMVTSIDSNVCQI